MTTVDEVRNQLRDVVDPCSAATGTDLDIVEMGLVKSIDVGNARVEVEMRLTSPMCHMVPYFIEEVEERVEELPTVETAELHTDNGFEWTQDMMTESGKQKRQSMLDDHEATYTRESPAR